MNSLVCLLNVPPAPRVAPLPTLTLRCLPPPALARQVYYPVAPEVHRDLLWEDVDVADPAEYTFCRYTPITTEVRVCWGEGGPCSSDSTVFWLGDAGQDDHCTAYAVVPVCWHGRYLGSSPACLIDVSFLLPPNPPQDARDFGSDGYSLRVQHKFSRHIKLLICVTLYNEDQETLGKTLLGICEARGGSGAGGGEGEAHARSAGPACSCACDHSGMPGQVTVWACLNALLQKGYAWCSS